MKKIILLIWAVFLFLDFNAQTDTARNKIQNTENQSHTQIGATNQPLDMSKTDGYIMKNGRMMSIKNGTTTPINSDVPFNNGMKIRNGKVYKKDGSTIMMKEGDYLDATGKSVPLGNSSDKDPSQMDKNVH